VGSVFVVAMSLSYGVGALSRAWFGCQPLWNAAVPTGGNFLNPSGSEPYFCSGTFVDLNFRGLAHASRMRPCHMRHTV
jgi:hypothetical protein